MSLHSLYHRPPCHRANAIIATLGVIAAMALLQGPGYAAELKVYDNVGIARTPYLTTKKGNKVSQNRCFNLCQSIGACKAVVFVKQTQRCRLYKDTSAAIAERGMIAGFLGPVILPEGIARPPNERRTTAIAPPPGSAQESTNTNPAAASSYTIQVGWDYPGADLRQLRDTNFDTCVKACDAQNACVAFNYDMRNDWCFLKQFLGNRIPDEKGFTAIKK